MGGIVGIIVKNKNGEQLGMDRWTNSMPYFFTRFELFANEDNDWFQDFCGEWLEMKDDYEQNKHTGKYQFEMTSSYFPHTTIHPEEYGVITVDLQNKKIYSAQDYCNIGSLLFSHVWNIHSKDHDEDIALLKKYFDNGYLKQIKVHLGIPDQYKIIDISSFTFKEVIQLLIDASNYDTAKYSHPLLSELTRKNTDIYLNSFLIDNGWKFSIYHDRYTGVLNIRKEMANDGFIFTDEDDQKWKQYLHHIWSDIPKSELETNQQFQDFKKLYLDVFKENYTN